MKKLLNPYKEEVEKYKEFIDELAIKYDETRLEVHK